jgi:hypothetical protein
MPALSHETPFRHFIMVTGTKQHRISRRDIIDFGNFSSNFFCGSKTLLGCKIILTNHKINCSNRAVQTALEAEHDSAKK